MLRLSSRFAGLVLVALCSWGANAQTPSDVPTSLAWDLAADARNAALGGLDVAPVQGDGWSAVLHPAAIDSTVSQDIYTSYLDYFAGIRGGAVAVPLAPSGRRASYVGIRFASYGSFEGTSAAGDPTGTFSGGDYAAQYGTSWVLDTLWVVGVSGYAGLRNLEQVNAGVLGADLGVVRRSRNGHGAVGLLISNLGVQQDFSGIMPEGRLPHNVQLGLTQGFPNAPFTFHLRLQRLETWELAPEGTYDDLYDPLTGEVIPNDTWVWGDQFFRHVTGGVTLNLGPQLRGYIGYNHQRQKTMAAAGRTGVNGMSLGVRGRFRNLDFSVARSVYHFAGSSTHLGLVLQLPKSRANSPSLTP
jgi:hypothetical protein